MKSPTEKGLLMLGNELSYLIAGYCGIFLSFFSTEKIQLLSLQASCHLLKLLFFFHTSVGREGLMFGFIVSS